MHALEIQTRYDLDEKGAHLLRRHDVRPALRVTVTRKIDRDDSVSLHEVGEYSMKGINALRPRARKKNGRAIRATGSSYHDIPSHTAQNSIGASLAVILRRHGSGVLRN